MKTDELREPLLELLTGQDAHMDFDEAVGEFPTRAVNERPLNVPYSPWQLLEHLRLSQRDILDYLTDPSYVAPPWPEGYWPADDATADAEAFQATLDGFRTDRETLRRLVAGPSLDPMAVLPNTPGHTLFREIRLVAAHNAYHLGEFAILRQVMGTWPATRRG